MIGRFLLRWLINAVAIYLTTRVISGIQVPDPLVRNTIVIALVLGVNIHGD